MSSLFLFGLYRDLTRHTNSTEENLFLGLGAAVAPSVCKAASSPGCLSQGCCEVLLVPQRVPKAVCALMHGIASRLWPGLCVRMDAHWCTRRTEVCSVCMCMPTRGHRARDAHTLCGMPAVREDEPVARGAEQKTCRVLGSSVPYSAP